MKRLNDWLVNATMDLGFEIYRRDVPDSSSDDNDVFEVGHKRANKGFFLDANTFNNFRTIDDFITFAINQFYYEGYHSGCDDTERMYEK